MIIKEIGKDKYYDKIVLLRCDECEKEFQRALSSTKRIRKQRGTEKDICRKCSFLPEYRRWQYGSERHNWREGKYTHACGYEMLLTYRDPEKKGAARYEFIHVLNMEKEIGRKLYRKESVHHIDCNKKNNDIDNLFLCDDEKKHQMLHVSMKKCGYELLEKYIYFNRIEKKYQLEKCNHKIMGEVETGDVKPTYHACRGVMYAFVRMNKKAKRYHVFVMENMIGRKIAREECVHHIDGDTVNNDINNLCLMTNSEHTLCHRSIEQCVAELYKQGVIGFNRDVGKYFIVQK